QSPYGAYTVTIQVSDVFGATTTDAANWYVYNPAEITGGNDCIDPDFTGACVAQLTFTGGSPSAPPQVRVTGISCDCGKAALPDVWSATVKGGTVNISAGLKPNTCSNYFADITLS